MCAIPDLTATGPWRQLRAARVVKTSTPPPCLAACQSSNRLMRLQLRRAASGRGLSPYRRRWRTSTGLARSCALVSRSAMACIAMRSMATSILRGLPPRRPLACAAAAVLQLLDCRYQRCFRLRPRRSSFRVRDRQADDGFPAVPAARHRQGPGRMESGDAGLQLPASAQPGKSMIGMSAGLSAPQENRTTPLHGQKAP